MGNAEKSAGINTTHQRVRELIMWNLSDYSLFTFGILFVGAGALILSGLAWAIYQGFKQHLNGAPQYVSPLAFCSLIPAGMFGLSFLMVGIAAMMLFGRNPAERNVYVDAVVHAQPANIDKIVITPESNIVPFRNIANKQIEITDRESIEAICRSLNSAKPEGSGSFKYASSIWKCQLELHCSTESYNCQVTNSRNYGCYIGLNDDGPYMNYQYGQFATTTLAQSITEAIEEYQATLNDEASQKSEDASD